MSSIASDLDDELFGPSLDLQSRPAAEPAPAKAALPATRSSLLAVPEGGGNPIALHAKVPKVSWWDLFG